MIQNAERCYFLVFLNSFTFCHVWSLHSWLYTVWGKWPLLIYYFFSINFKSNNLHPIHSSPKTKWNGRYLSIFTVRHLKSWGTRNKAFGMWRKANINQAILTIFISVESFWTIAWWSWAASYLIIYFRLNLGIFVRCSESLFFPPYNTG